MTFEDRTVLRVGAWRVDPTTDEISDGAETHKLEPRTMRLLLYLAAHPGKVIGVHQLLDDVWSGVVVTPGSVYQAIAQLRRLLGDHAEHPIYIDTHSRKGYRLVARVSPWAEPVKAGQLPNAIDSAVPRAGSNADADGLRARRRLLAASVICAVLAAAALAWFFARRAAPITPALATFAPPPHSIAVLPFVNMSGDKEQEYFSDGVTEEILNSLSRINELQVAARTSAFSFKGKDVKIGTIARELNVGSILEGSVRRSGHTVRVTAQLNNAITGFHVWSETYDRDLSDILKLQTEIANAVAGALKVTLLDNVSAKIELGGTRNPAAFDAYLRGAKAYVSATDAKQYQAAIVAFTEAIRLDPNYALALANRSISLTYSAAEASGPDVRENFDKAESDAHSALALAPDLVEGHLALAYNFEAGLLDFSRANQEYERALALAPSDVRVLRDYATFAVPMGRTEVGIAAARRAVVLDPLNEDAHHDLGWTLYYGRQNRQAVAAYQAALALTPEDSETYALRGLAYYALGDLETARTSCEKKPDYYKNQHCLALTYDKLGRHADAEAVLAQIRAARGDRGAYLYATVEAQWGNVPKALEWLDTAMGMRDPALELLKTDPLLDPLRKEPRFQAVVRELKFPE